MLAPATSNCAVTNVTYNENKYCCDRKSRAACAQSFTLWQQATIEFTCHDHSPRTLVVTFNRSQVNIGRASTPQSLFYSLFAPYICMVLFFRHIPFMVSHTFNAAPPERLQQYYVVTWAVYLQSSMYLRRRWLRHQILVMWHIACWFRSGAVLKFDQLYRSCF